MPGDHQRDTSATALAVDDERPRKKRYLEDQPTPKPGNPDAPGYYDLPMLKAPVWTREVTAYFFLGGVSAGAFVLSRLAERIGGESFRDLTRAGTVVAAVSAVPCAPLLILDLGDPKRFHHMLRVWKPSSPMNLGSWTLTGYSVAVALAALREFLRPKPGSRDTDASGAVRLLRRADGTLTLAIDGAGIPLALLLATYTGVLLTGSAVPAWSQNPYLGSLFMSSAMSTGAAAVNLALGAQQIATNDGPEATNTALDNIATTAHAAEETALTAYLKSAGEYARPMTKGALAPLLWGGVIGAGLVLPEILSRIPAPKKVKPWLRVAGSIATLVGGALLRYVVMKAGHLSASDPKANRRFTHAKTGGTANPRKG